MMMMMARRYNAATTDTSGNTTDAIMQYLGTSSRRIDYKGISNRNITSNDDSDIGNNNNGTPSTRSIPITPQPLHIRIRQEQLEQDESDSDMMAEQREHVFYSRVVNGINQLLLDDHILQDSQVRYQNERLVQNIHLEHLGGAIKMNCCSQFGRCTDLYGKYGQGQAFIDDNGDHDDDDELMLFDFEL